MKQYNPSETEVNVEIHDAQLMPGLPDAEYREMEGYNQSFLKDALMVSPSHATYRRQHPEETPALLFGTALHTALLEPSKFESEFVVAPECDRRTTNGKAIWMDFLAEAKGRKVLKAEDSVAITDMRKAVEPMFGATGTTFKTFHEPACRANATITIKTKGSDADTIKRDVVLKAKLDQLAIHNDKKVVVKDLKTIADIRNVVSSSHGNGWALQSAFYTDILKAMLPENEVVSFYYIVVSKEQPYDARAFLCSPQMIEQGRSKWIDALARTIWWDHNGRPDTAEFHGVQMLNG